MTDYTLSLLSESCMLFRLDGNADETNTRRLLSIYHELKASSALQALGVLDLVPAYQVLALHFTGNEHHGKDIQAFIRNTVDVEDVKPYRAGKTHILPVRYDGPDLDAVADHSGLTVEEIVQRHTQSEYFVAMIGFKPHFPYLMGLDPTLEMPRLENPRGDVPAGTVGIGGNQTGVYSVNSPGGWNLIGQTDPELLIPIQPGDQVVFTREEATC